MESKQRYGVQYTLTKGAFRINDLTELRELGREETEEILNRVNALEAERDALRSEMEYARLYLEAADHRAAYEVLTQALTKGGGDE